MAEIRDEPVAAAGGPWVELRIHGVSGTPPESMLESAHVRQVAGDAWGRFFRPVDSVGGEVQDDPDRLLEGYHWGKYTSGSALQGIWLILIPFGLVNAAAFMAPNPGTSSTTKRLHAGVQAMIRSIGMGVTATFALAASLILVDLVAGQWAPGLPWLDSVPTGSVMTAGVLSAGGVMGALFWLGNENRTSDFSSAPAESLAAGMDTGLGRESFFEVSDESSPILGRLHLSVGWSVVALVGALAWQTIAGHGDSRFAADLQHGVWLLSLLLICVLTIVVTCLGDAQQAVIGSELHAWWHRTALPVISDVAVGLSGAALICSAALLWGTDRQNFVLDVDDYTRWLATAAGLAMVNLLALNALLAARTPELSTDSRSFRRYARGLAPWAATSVGVFLGVGFCAAFVLGVAKALNANAKTEFVYRVAYSWGLTVLLLTGLAVVVVCFVWPTKKRSATTSAPYAAVTSGPLTQPLSSSWGRQVAAAMRMAELKQHIAWGFVLFAASGWLMTAVTAIEMLRGSTAFLGWLSRHLGWFGYLSQRPTADSHWWVVLISNLGTYSLIALAGLMFLLGRRALRTETTRRGINVVWDVVSFWPHSAHPFVPPAYSQFAVHDLLRRIRFHLGLLDLKPDRIASSVVVSAHSQGSLIAFASMLWLPPQQLARVGLVTYGSQLQVAYPRGFPAYVDFGLVTQVQESLGCRWVNLYRETDPIAGPVLSWHRSPMDAAPPVPDPPTSQRVGASGELVDFLNPTTGRRESGHDWRVLDPPPVDVDLQVSTIVHLSRHSGYPGSIDYPDAVAHVRPG
jgi:hypothetical protein